MKVCYIAHPISGNVQKNLAHLFLTIEQVQRENPEIYAFAPYVTDAIALNDAQPEHRTIAMDHCRLVLETFPIDEVWLTGDKISAGMTQEKEWAEQRGIPVVNKIGLFKFNV